MLLGHRRLAGGELFHRIRRFLALVSISDVPAQGGTATAARVCSILAENRVPLTEATIYRVEEVFEVEKAAEIAACAETALASGKPRRARWSDKDAGWPPDNKRLTRMFAVEVD